MNEYDVAEGVLNWWSSECIEDFNADALAKLLTLTTGSEFAIDEAADLIEYASVKRDVTFGADPEDYEEFGHDPNAALDHHENAAYAIFNKHFRH